MLSCLLSLIIGGNLETGATKMTRYSSLASSIFVNRKKRNTMDPNLVRLTVTVSQHRERLRESPCLSQLFTFYLVISSEKQLNRLLIIVKPLRLI